MNRGLRGALARSGVGRRSEEERTVAPIVSTIVSNVGRTEQVARTQDRSEVQQSDSFAVSDGTVIRVRIGRQSDGSYGLRVWNSAGALVHDLTTT